MLVMKVQLGQICDAVKSTVPQEMWRAIVEMGRYADGYSLGSPTAHKTTHIVWRSSARQPPTPGGTQRRWCRQ
jgi:hypothetical protein